jgi:YceI-like domain
VSSIEQRIDLTKVELPEPGTWVIDPGHSEVAFVARHLMVAKVRGRFDDVAGSIHLAETPEQSWVEVTIKTASIDSKNADRDKDLRSPNFLDVERFPEITFRSTKVEPTGESTFRLTGDLSIRDVTKPVVLEAEYLGQSLASSAPDLGRARAKVPGSGGGRESTRHRVCTRSLVLKFGDGRVAGCDLASSGAIQSRSSGIFMASGPIL